ncbi:alanine racemase [Candidatus Peregrinibacteria bacterium]|nr:alanine racemase [Candidatus Peregrinibacteria bacterium]
MNLTWVEISKQALIHNLHEFRKLIGPHVVLAPAIKANAYGHGLVECGTVFAEHGADYLCANALYEVEALRKAGIKIPILIIGYTPLSDLGGIVRLKAETIVYNLETLHGLAALGKPIGIHLKIETGNHRQGIEIEQLPTFVALLKKHPQLELKGVSTHFANLEDRLNQHYSRFQLKKFEEAIHALELHGMAPHYRHCAATAGIVAFPEAHFNFVRLGIGSYGLWPSPKTLVAAERLHLEIKPQPVLTWKTIIAQVKEVKKGSLVGYGCTYEMKHDGRVAVLPIGYYDGFVRALGNKGFVLIHGRRAPVVGRVCMNMIMVDVSHIPQARLEDEVVLIGKQGNEIITSEEMGELSNTIHYEVTTRINERIPRMLKP